MPSTLIGEVPELSDFTSPNTPEIGGTESASDHIDELAPAAPSLTSAEQREINYKLYKAARNGDLESVKELMENGAKPDVSFGPVKNTNSLMEASQHGHTEVVRYLIEHGLDVNAVDEYGNTALILACMCHSNNVETVELLLQHGADVDARDAGGYTALMQAFNGEDTDNIIDTLLAHNAGVNIHTASGLTALMIASQLGNNGAVSKLIKAGADIDATTAYGLGKETALIFASINGHTEVIDTLLKNGADIKITNEYGLTPLMAASQFGHTKAIKKLLDAGADINSTSTNGVTALMLAFTHTNEKVVNTLLKNGADVSTVKAVNSCGNLVPEAVTLLNKHNGRLGEVADFLISNISIDEQQNVSVKDDILNEDQNALLEDAQRFHKGNIKDALITKGINKEQAQKIIEALV
jgi:uncharacterized protein